MERIELLVSSQTLVRMSQKTGFHLLRNLLAPRKKRDQTDRTTHQVKMSLVKS